MENPAISVIIPMYNAEKYIGECLDSLLKQTFQDFEIIIVDDCSIDNSVETAQNYLEKFNRQHILVKRKKNSGNFGYTARNRGFKQATGKYVFFMDADDMLTPDALEELYNSAKNFNADVVYTGARYLYTSEKGAELKLDKEGRIWQKKNIVETQRLTVRDPHKLLENFLISGGVFWTPWTKFVRRQFLIENNIEFYEILSGGDYIWTVELLCCASRFVRIPKAFYIWRSDSETSVSRIKRNTEAQINTWNEAFVHSIRALADVLNKRYLLRKKSTYAYFALKNFFEWCFERNVEARAKVNPEKFYEILNNEFGVSEFDMLAKFFFSVVDSQQKKIKELELKDKKTGYPKISVVIPLYNAEKYIGECFDSILNQTFQDFEVIVVDDCSTDKSMEVVKSYVPKFNGRLRYSATKENSGGGGYVPRNIGINLARGEYICFVDADDFILLTALEKLYNAAESHKADVVYISNRYLLTKPDEIIKQMTDRKGETSLNVNNPEKNLEIFFLKACHHTPYQKFCRRDFLIENEIFFPKIITYGDALWTIHVFACSKRFLRIPDALYFYRKNPDSVTLSEDLPEKQICYRARAFLLAINALVELSEKINLPEKYLAYLFNFMQNAFGNYLKRTLNARANLSTNEIFTALYREFYQKNISFSWCLPFMFASLGEGQKKSPDVSRTVARIDVTLTSAEGNLKILSINDSNSTIKKANWLPKDKNGYMIQSDKGDLEFVIKSNSNGKIRLSLKGPDIRDPKDHAKRVQRWADYTKLAVNGKTIFDKIIPAWHDKSYDYSLDIAADKEVKIKTAWIAHKE